MVLVNCQYGSATKTLTLPKFTIIIRIKHVEHILRYLN